MIYVADNILRAKNIRFKTSMFRSDFCDYSDAYVEEIISMIFNVFVFNLFHLYTRIILITTTMITTTINIVVIKQKKCQFQCLLLKAAKIT